MLLLKLSTGIQRLSQTPAKRDSLVPNVVYITLLPVETAETYGINSLFPFFRYKLLLLEKSESRIFSPCDLETVRA